MANRLFVFVGCLTALSVVLLLIPALKGKKRRKGKTRDNNNTLFFPDKSGKNASSLLSTISSLPEISLDVCVYCLAGREFLDAILSVHERGVPVRIITDNEEETYTQITRLRKGGIQVRTNNSSDYLMHHKFTIINRSLVITGSLNWTRQGINGNHENVIMTDDVKHLNTYAEKFEELWNLFDPMTQPF